MGTDGSFLRGEAPEHAETDDAPLHRTLEREHMSPDTMPLSVQPELSLQERFEAMRKRRQGAAARSLQSMTPNNSVRSSRSVWSLRRCRPSSRAATRSFRKALRIGSLDSCEEDCQP